MISLVNIQAQSWERTEHHADALKGTESYTSFMYTTPSVGSFVCWSNNPNSFRIINEAGIFNYTSYYNQYLGTVRGLDVIIGLYDENDNLKEKFKIWLDCESDKPTFLEAINRGALFNPVGRKKKIKKTLKHLTSGKGYVRIIADTYGTSPNFDLKIPSTLVIK